MPCTTSSFNYHFNPLRLKPGETITPAGVQPEQNRDFFEHSNQPFSVLIFSVVYLKGVYSSSA